MESIGGERLAWQPGIAWLRKSLLVAAVAAIGFANRAFAQNVAPPDLRYGGTMNWNVSGPAGGPFSSSGFTTKIGNRSTQPLSWTASSIPSFVNVNPSSGTMQGHTRIPFVVSLDTAAAQSLAAGTYSEVLRLHNNTTTEADIVVSCTLTVTGPPVDTLLQPSSSFDTQGPASGPFVPDSASYNLTNNGTASIDWTAAASDAWLVVAPASGQLAPGATVRIDVAVADAATAGLSQSNHRSTFEVREAATDRLLHSRDVNVTILGPTLASTLTPSTGFPSQGPASGPFQPDTKTYTLTNTGTASLGWAIGLSDPWVAAVPASGQLAPGASANIVVSITDPATGSLSNGLHQATVEWRDTASSQVLHSRGVDLTVQPGPTMSGWTTFTPSADTRMVYVSSSSGNDGNDGLSQSTPKRTLAAGRNMLRNGYPDWLLLRAGDTWDEAFGNGWQQSGRSATERMLVTSYGTGNRPMLRSGVNNGLSIWNAGSGSNLAFVGLHFWPHTYNGANGSPRCIGVFGAVSNLLVEDCYLQAGETNVVIQGANEYPSPTGRHQNIAFRRNVVVDAYNTLSTNSQGIYVSGTDGFLLEDNVFDHNGWRDDVPGSGPTWYRHNIYIQNLNTGVVCRGNIVASTDGMHTRSGGLVEENLIMHAPLCLVLGVGGYPAIEADGVDVNVRRNVILDGGDFQAGSPRGWGMWMSNIRSGTFDSNVIAHNVNGHMPFPVSFDVAVNGRGVENTTFSNNVIFNWNGFSRFTGNGSQMRNIQLTGNKFQNHVSQEPLIVHDQSSSTGSVYSANNIFDTNAVTNACMQVAGGNMPLTSWKPLVHDTTSVEQSVSFPDPNRTISTYHASIGGGASLTAFMNEARRQSKTFWRTAYTAKAVNDYIRAGFGMP